MKAAEELQKLGFRLQAIAGTIRIYWDHDEKLVPENAQKLIDEVRVEKSKALRFLRSSGDPFEAVFLDTVDEINKWYVWGTLEYIQQERPALYSRIRHATNRVDEIWEAACSGEPVMKEFKEAVAEWRQLHFEAINSFIVARLGLDGVRGLAKSISGGRRVRGERVRPC